MSVRANAVAASRPRIVVVAWNRFQSRTRALGPALGGTSYHIHGGWPGRHPAVLLLRYLADGVRMWGILRHRRPDVVVVISPPVVAPLVAWLWCLIHGGLLVVDCHTGALHSPKWGWARPLHRFLFRQARAVLVHTEEDERGVRRWGVPAVLVPDDLPEADQASPPAGRATKSQVVVAGSFDWNEPVATALATARLLPDMEVRLTGDTGRLSASVCSSAAANVVFTGYLPYEQFLGELITADVVAAFSIDPHIMNRAAFEAIGLGRPLVLSDLPGLRARFGEAAIFCANEPASMAQAIRRAQQDQVSLVARGSALKRRLQAQRDAAITQLRSMIETPQRPGGLAARVHLRP
jgi:glycosyltransferase involved in cell wall biosynthesis